MNQVLRTLCLTAMCDVSIHITLVVLPTTLFIQINAFGKIQICDLTTKIIASPHIY